MTKEIHNKEKNKEKNNKEKKTMYLRPKFAVTYNTEKKKFEGKNPEEIVLRKSKKSKRKEHNACQKM